MREPQNEDRPEAEGGITFKQREAFVSARARWRMSGTVEAQQAMLSAGLPLLQALEPLCDEDQAWILKEALAAIEDGIEGRGWDALTWRRKGNWSSTIQRRRMAFAHCYIRAAQAGRIDDPNPYATVCAAFSVRGRKPLDRRTVEKWRERFSLDLSHHDIFFSQERQDFSARAKELLNEIGTQYRDAIRAKPSNDKGNDYGISD